MPELSKPDVKAYVAELASRMMQAAALSLERAAQHEKLPQDAALHLAWLLAEKLPDACSLAAMLLPGQFYFGLLGGRILHAKVTFVGIVEMPDDLPVGYAQKVFSSFEERTGAQDLAKRVVEVFGPKCAVRRAYAAASPGEVAVLLMVFVDQGRGRDVFDTQVNATFEFDKGDSEWRETGNADHGQGWQAPAQA